MRKHPMKNLNVEYWPYKNGAIGAFIQGVPGAIYAQDATAFASGFKHVFDLFIAWTEAIERTGETSGAFDLKAEMAWIDGRLAVRWLEVPGFGIDFADEQELQEFIKALFIPPDKKAMKAKMN